MSFITLDFSKCLRDVFKTFKLYCMLVEYHKIKGGANRANILVNIACQHSLPKVLSRFAVATNMLAKGKISQNDCANIY